MSTQNESSNVFKEEVESIFEEYDPNVFNPNYTPPQKKKPPILKRIFNFFKKEQPEQAKNIETNNPEIFYETHINQPPEDELKPTNTDVADIELVFDDPDLDVIDNTIEQSPLNPIRGDEDVLSSSTNTPSQPAELDIGLDAIINNLKKMLDDTDLSDQHPVEEVEVPQAENDILSLRSGYSAECPPPEHIKEYKPDYYQSLRTYSHYQNYSGAPFDYTIDRDTLRSNPYRLIQKIKETLDHINRSIDLIDADHQHVIINYLVDTLAVMTGNSPVAYCKENIQPFVSNLFLENKHLRKILQESKTIEYNVTNLYNELVNDVNKDREERRLTIKSYITTKKAADIAYMQLRWCIQKDERYNVSLDTFTSKAIFTKSVRERFKTLRDLALATQAEIINNYGIGQTTLENIINYFNENKLVAICFYPDFGYFDEVYFIKTQSIENFEFLMPRYLSKNLNKFETSQYFRLGSNTQAISPNTHTATINDYAEKYPYFFDERGDTNE